MTPLNRSALLLSLPLLLSACPGPEGMTPPADLGMAGEPQTILATSDFKSGALSTVGLTTKAVRKAVAGADAQTVVRVYDGKLYALDQSLGVVRVHDPAQNLAALQEFPAAGPGVPAAQANPHDIYVDSARKRAYLTLYGAAMSSAVDGAHALGIVDLGNPGAGIAGFLPLQVAAADPDKNPEADRFVACGGSLYLTLQDLDRNKFYAPAAPARLAVIDLAAPTTTPIGYIPLKGQNPIAITPVGLDRGQGCTALLIGHGDNQYGGTLSDRGGLELVDLAMRSTRMLRTAKDLGGNVSALGAEELGRVYVDLLVTQDSMNFDHSVQVMDLTGQAKGTQVLGPLSFVPAVRVHKGQVLVLSAGTPDMARGHLPVGLYLGPADGAALARTPLDVGLPPISVDIF